MKLNIKKIFRYHKKPSEDIFPENSGLNNFFKELGELSLFTIQFFKELFKPPYEHREFLRQAYKIGLNTLPLIWSRVVVTWHGFCEHCA